MPNNENKKIPPTPKWRPEIIQPHEKIVDRIRYYSNGSMDFAVFRHGTIVLLVNELSENDAISLALKTLEDVLNFHPDMQPREMDDGNLLVAFGEHVANVVLSEVSEEHWDEIEANHQRALTADEVILTPLGPNIFDNPGKKALFGRCYMFMDAQDPEVVEIVRATT